MTIAGLPLQAAGSALGHTWVSDHTAADRRNPSQFDQQPALWFTDRSP